MVDGRAAPARARVLVIGGSTEASALAERLDHADAFDVVTSLAGRTAQPNAIAGEVRIGGFGGVTGLAEWLRAEHVRAVVDASHPFTAQMPAHVRAACLRVGVPRLRLRRRGWTPGPGDRWTVVADHDAAVATLGSMGSRRVFLTTGRQVLAPYARLPGVWFLVRSIDPPSPQPLPDAEVVLDRGPFDADDEEVLMASRRIDALVTKNSGGSAAAGKLAAARRLGIPVVVLARPPAPPGPCAVDVDEALDWCAEAVRG